MLKGTKLSVIVPAYNKGPEVFEAVSRIVQQLKKLVYDWEIIVVDDASKDQTLREAVRSKRFNGNSTRIKIYSYNLNLGKGFALYFGFKKSQGDIVIFADSDLDLPASNLPVLLHYFERESANITIGSKRHILSRVSYPLPRKIMSSIYYLLVKMLFNLDVTDTQVGLKAFRREVLDACFPRIVVKTFAFDLELLVVAKILGYREIVEAPVTLNYNFSSTIRISNIIKILQDTLAVYYRKYILKYYDLPHNRLEVDESSFVKLQKAFI